jgi:two-component sensor histidine kinase
MFTTIYSMEVENDGIVWYTTSSGLFRFDSDTGKTKHISYHHGLPKIDFDFGVSHQGADGTLYFGGNDGYTRFHPSNIDISIREPKLVLSGISWPGSTSSKHSDLKQLEKIQLPHNNYFISFEFSVLDFLDPEKNQYRYMLEGFDPEWIENGNRNTATYTNLPAGNYTFRAQGANSAGVWNREGIALEVAVLPAPWLTWWAFCLYSIPVIAAFFLYRKMYGDNLLKKQAIQSARENQMIADRAQDDLLEQQDLQDRLVRSIYQHNLTTLATVQNIMNRYFDMRDGRSEGRSNGERDLHIEALSTLEGCLYHQDDCLVADLHKYTDRILAALLQDAPFPRESLITINDATKTHIPAEFATVLAIAILELVENSIRHAFIGRRTGHILHIELRAEPEAHAVPDYYKLSVQDNGIGLPAGFDLSSVATPGFGLLYDLAARYCGRLDAVSSEGTTVALSIPTTVAQSNRSIGT